MSTLCPACESGTLVTRVGDKVIRFEGEPLRVQNLRYSECQACGEKVVLPEQSKRNEVAYADAKKDRLDLWSCGKIEAFRKQWQLTQGAAARLFGGGANAFSKYERGVVIHSRPMDLLMRVFAHSEEARMFLTQMAGISLPEVTHWETIRHAPPPRRQVVDVEKFLRSYENLQTEPANQERWETYEPAHAP